MYSIVMMAAMTTAPEAPDFFFKNKGGGCYGCYGGGCYGSGCYGSGWGCGGGCYGGGGCMSYSAGCHGGGWGKFGGHAAFVGGNGCCGTAAYAGCGGYTAGYYAPGGPVYTGYAGGGYYYGPGGPGVGVGVTGSGATGTGTDAGPGTGTGTGTGTDRGTGPGTGTSPGTGGKGGGSSGPGTGGSGNPGGGPGAALGVPEAIPFLPAGRAQVVVRMPADAKLFADGQATIQGGTERVFLTPELSGARDYQYTLSVEHPAGGEPQTKKVVVRPGHRTVVEFGAAVAAEKVTSPVTVALPQKARLYVDGVATGAAAGTTTFRTPELTKGKAYVYEFRAEVEKEGKTEVLSRNVTFKGGEAVTVDFVEPAGTRTASSK
jgi:uncharacterized protein (TIGR03000 family)